MVQCNLRNGTEWWNAYASSERGKAVLWIIKSETICGISSVSPETYALHYRYAGRTEGLWCMCRHGPVIVQFFPTKQLINDYVFLCIIGGMNGTFVWRIHILFTLALIRSLELSLMKRNGPGTFVPLNFISLELLFLGVFAPRNVRSMELAFPVSPWHRFATLISTVGYSVLCLYSNDIYLLTRNCAIKCCHLSYKCCINKR